MRLKKLADHPLVGEARGVGLIGAVELVADKATKRPFDPKKMVGATTVNACRSWASSCATSRTRSPSARR